MSSSLLTGLSGFQAADARLGARASNLANIQSTGPLPADPAAPNAANTQAGKRQAYQAVEPVTQSVSGGGVKTLLQPTSPAFIQQYAPDSTDANAQGLVAAPNIDLTAQITGSILDSAYAKLNASVIRTSDEVLQTAINLKT
jgi:flagellar basal-body rod protein FlgC